MTRILAGVFAICAAGCAFDASGTPMPVPDAAATVGGAPDGAAGSIDAAPATIDAAPTSPPDACVGKRCDEGGGPGG
jgi:hypothetical protein